MLSRNGILQAHDSKVAEPASVTVAAVMPLERTSPIGTPNWGQLPRKPFRFGLPHSIDISTEPPHSPPTPMPWQARRMTRITAAHRPMLVYVGMTPIKNVAIPMNSKVTIKVALRPMRSP